MIRNQKGKLPVKLLCFMYFALFYVSLYDSTLFIIRYA